MSRKLRTPKGQVLALPSPAWTYGLLTGQDPHCRLPGWPAMFQQRLGEPDAAQVWAQHGEALIAEARAHGFEPFALTRQRPSGPAGRSVEARLHAPP
jgi:hypothetical protein